MGVSSCEEEGKEGGGSKIKGTARQLQWNSIITSNGPKMANSLVMDCRGRDREGSPLEGPLGLTFEVSVICLNPPLSMNKLLCKAVNSQSVPALKQ